MSGARRTARCRLLLVGVGGQGVLTAAQVLADAALQGGVSATVGQLHGMSQRGGSIVCTVLLGGYRGTQIPDGGADLALAFEPLELARHVRALAPHARVLCNGDVRAPCSLAAQGAEYPTLDALLDPVRARVRTVRLIAATALAGAAGGARHANIVLLGALGGAGLWPPDGAAGADTIAAALAHRFRGAERPAVLFAYAAGRRAGAEG